MHLPAPKRWQVSDIVEIFSTGVNWLAVLESASVPSALCYRSYIAYRWVTDYTAMLMFCVTADAACTLDRLQTLAVAAPAASRRAWLRGRTARCGSAGDHSPPDCLTDVIDDTHQRAIVKARQIYTHSSLRVCTAARRRYNDGVLWACCVRQSSLRRLIFYRILAVRVSTL